MSILPFELSQTEYKYLADDRLRFAIRGDVESGFKIETQKQETKRAVQYLELFEIANLVAEEKGISQDEAFQLVSSAAANPRRIGEIGEHTGKIKEILQKAPVSEELDTEIAAAFVRFRGEYKEGNKWKSLNDWCRTENGCDWGLEQQSRLPADLTRKIYNLAVQERDGKKEQDDEQVPLENESADSESGSTPQPTGNESSGESKPAPSPKTKDSTPETSPTNSSE